MSTTNGLDALGFYSPTPVDHPARSIPRSGFPTGPEIGAPVPPIRLTDQHGEVLDVHEHLGPKGAIISFQRSAFW